MLTAYVHIHALMLVLGHRIAARRPDRSAWAQRGQTTAEYALVLLGAAAVAMLVVAWAARTNRIGHLLDAVIDKLMSRVS
jgi:hypothetical protein